MKGIKNHSTVKRTTLLWLILLSPIVGLVANMIATHYGLDNVDGWKVTAAVLAAWWMLLFAFTRWLSWRAPRPA
jgi:hypothetical protein